MSTDVVISKYVVYKAQKLINLSSRSVAGTESGGKGRLIRRLLPPDDDGLQRPLKRIVDYDD